MSFTETARMVAAIRAIDQETKRSDSSISFDPAIEKIVPLSDLEKIKKLLKLNAATYEFVISRYRYIDRCIISLQKSGYRSVVLLGAGLDTRPYRIKDLNFVEVDLTKTIQSKKKLIQDHGITPLNTVRYIGIDLASSLISSKPCIGFDIKDLPQPIAVVAEGLFYYLPRATLEGLLNLVNSSPNTALLIDFMKRDLLEKSGPRAFQRRIKKNGESIQTLWDKKEFVTKVKNCGITDLEVVDTIQLIKNDFPDTDVKISNNFITFAKVPDLNSSNVS